jgi:predicted dehydrogenase
MTEVGEPHTIRFGIIGCGLMGREFASAAARWCHLLDVGFRPEIVAVCDLDDSLTDWFKSKVPTVTLATRDHRELIADARVEAVHCAVPHNLHQQLYVDILSAGKHLLGEKPFGIDRAANRAILKAVKAHPDLLVRCSSEFPFYPGAHRIAQWMREDVFGQILEVEAGFWHSSDLNPDKPINWKRRIETNGAHGCMGDLGMHVCHLPLRAGWMPRTVRAQLVNAVRKRPDGKGNRVPCETWDNAILSCDVEHAGQSFPMTLSMKRIAPGHANTWFIRIWGTRRSAEYSTQFPKTLRWMDYTPGGEQIWQTIDLPHTSAYPVITGSIFEFGFSDAILQMWAAFCDELVNRDKPMQPLLCATPREAAQSHAIFTAAQESQRTGRVMPVRFRDV